jgi:hypothetical protein
LGQHRRANLGSGGGTLLDILDIELGELLGEGLCEPCRTEEPAVGLSR